MEYSVKLASLPEKVRIPERLRERMSFDAARGQLTYRGFMTKCTYDELAALDDDVNYHRALEELFVLTSEEIAPRPRSRGLSALLLVTAAAALLAAAVFWTIRHRSHSEPQEQISTATVSTGS
jgi:hypothetical protein